MEIVEQTCGGKYSSPQVLPTAEVFFLSGPFQRTVNAAMVIRARLCNPLPRPSSTCRRSRGGKPRSVPTQRYSSRPQGTICVLNSFHVISLCLCISSICDLCDLFVVGDHAKRFVPTTRSDLCHLFSRRTHPIKSSDWILYCACYSIGWVRGELFVFFIAFL